MNFDIVVSNPPYIPAIDMESLTMDVLKYESHEALCGGNDGLDIIRVIVQRLPEWMKGAKSRQKYCWLEVDDSHPRLLEKWLFPGSDESNR
jgi:release factor glutamine methyltransferase